MAIGPQLAGIQPNEGSLLTDGQVRNIAPRELVFRFSGMPLDEQTLDAIHITRSGFDGQFSKSIATTDFNTNGNVVMDFTAVDPGEASNGISLVFIKNNLGTSKPPRISVLGDTISVELNSNATSPTKARELRDAINTNPEASKLILASIRLATNANADIATPAITYSPLILAGANAASVTSSFNTGTPLQVKFTARQAGPAGNGIRVFVTRTNFGGVAPPKITVNGRDITVTLNSNTSNPSTAKDLVDAINRDTAASALITASIPVGRSDTVVGTRVINFSPLVLSGANDVPIVPGFIGLGDTPQDVVVRFAENLPDDLYHIEIVGAGANALRDVEGVAFNDTTDDGVDNGRDFHLDFELDLGAQIIGVVPQPITRNVALGTLDQNRDQIQVYFNQDDLYPSAVRTGDLSPNPAVVDPTFYRLIFTSETLDNSDDKVYFPTRVHYDPQTDMAVLTFADDLTKLGSGAGTFRLRVGTNEDRPLAPLRAATAADPGSSFTKALQIGRTLDVLGTGAAFQEGQTFTITDQNGKAQTFEFDTGFVLRVPGNGAAGLADGQFFRITNGAFSATFEFDQDGTVGPNRTAITYLGNETAGQMADRIVAAINGIAGLALTAVHLGDGRIQLGGTANHTLTTVNSGLTQTGTPGAQTANAIAVRFLQSPSMLRTDVAQALATAINQADFAVDATVSGDRILLLGSSSIVTSTGLSGLSARLAQDMILSSAIEAQPYGLDMPGAPDEPGHRDIPIETHYLGGADGQDGVTTGYYNFANVYGFDPQGNPLFNLISEEQKERTREIFDLYGRYLGIQFVETASQGLTIATGDLRAVDPEAVTGPDGLSGISGLGLAVMDNAENWDDSFGRSDSPFQKSWFETAFHEIGHLLGLGHTYDLPPGTVMGDEPLLSFGQEAEAVYPGDADIVHGRYMFRPESTDIDLYRFDVPEAGVLTFETFAERLQNSSLLDTALTLYRQEADGSRALVARNDDYYSHDSFLEFAVRPGVYYVGVSASKNAQYDPTIEDSGFGGTTQGSYELRMDFRPTANRVLKDATGTSFDGDLDGIPGGVYNFWFRAEDPLNTIYVDKASGVSGTGALGTPYRNLGDALAAAAALPDAIRQQTVIRVVGNGGADGNLGTVQDNLAYEIGFNQLGTPLPDGDKFDVPQGVTVMIDAGAVFKLRRAEIVAGSTTQFVDRSAASLQVLGTPRLLDNFGAVIRDTNGTALPGSVYFTSIQDDAVGVDSDPRTSSPVATPGDWGGLSFRNDIDQTDPTRPSYERRGIFLNYVNYADLRYGGGTVVVEGIPQAVAPLEMGNSRPTLTFNTVRFSADAALGASPDSFEETNFHAPPDQLIPFTSDYSRVGPEIYGNTLTDNSLNGLFIRVQTPAGNALRPLTVSGRWDDSDITHILTETLEVRGQAGGPLREQTPPPVELVTLTSLSGGKLDAGSYNYRITFVDRDGNEGAPSSATRTLTITGEPTQGTIRLDNLPTATGDFVARRIYRSDDTGDLNGIYTLVAEIDPSERTFTDTGESAGSILQVDLFDLRPRLDARLAIDPGTIVKLNAGAIQTTFGGQLLSEGLPGLPVVMTSVQDDRYGGSGTFDVTNNEQQQTASPGDWGGLFIGHTTKASIDYSVLAYGGGLARIEGGFAGFNAVEIHQADVRITHSELENNGSGLGDNDQNRSGRGSHDEGTIFVRGAQPIIAGNLIVGNEGPAVSININAMSSDVVTDWGRSTYNRGSALSRGSFAVDAYTGLGDNEGPLVRFNRLNDNAVNGMQVRGGTLTTESIWDDTDIVHVVRSDDIVIPDLHTFGGLRLESSATESLVVKLEGTGTGGSEGLIRATGRPLDIDDRIGGSLAILGQPGFPVILTSIKDDTVGAGFMPDGNPQVDTNNDGLFTAPGDGGGTPGGGTGTLVVATPTNNANLLRDTLLGPGVTPVGNATLVGSATSAATFTGGSSSIGIEAGIVLTTGDAAEAGGPNKFDGTTGTASNAGDADLDATFNVVTEDTTYLQFDFLTDSGNLFFNFVFASEEYNEFANSSFNDVFAFYVDGQNIAFVPGTTTPISINTINGGNPLGTSPQNPQYYKNNDLDDNGQFLTAVEYDGFTTVFTATKLGLGPGLHTIKLAISDVADSALDTAVFLELGSFSDAPGGSAPGGGDWGGIQIDAMANDRNVASVLETEARDRAAPGPNATPATAQYLGGLAPNEKSGDENLRLGFEVQGLLGAPNDVDVYSFDARAGTEVWFDVDRTAASLDSVIELLNSAGTVIARSDNSGAETTDPTLLFRGTGIATSNVQPLKKSVFDIPDRYTTNPRDAGMRVILPGVANSSNTYHVRVRSASPNLNNLQGGLTAGKYQLQIRLREENEFPGSTVRYADVRFAETGITVTGQPGHSPLTGEAGETESASASGVNDTQTTADVLGNLLNTDRGALSVAGSLGNSTDVDWYRFDVAYDSVQGTVLPNHTSVIFDLDYADGIARANSNLWVFDSNGNLILRGGDSNVAGDRPSPLAGANLDDLSRGSAGPLDPYIGPVALPSSGATLGSGLTGQTYYVAVTSNAILPTELQQFATALPANPFVRVEPVNSLVRSGEDMIGRTDLSNIPGSPQVPVMFDSSSIVPYKLGDLVLFVTQDSGSEQTRLRIVDPFTGAVENTVGVTNQNFEDIAMNPAEGILYGVNSREFQPTDANTGGLYQIDPRSTNTTALNVLIGDDGIETYVDDPMNPGNAIRAAGGPGVGVHFNATAIGPLGRPSGLTMYAIGNRGDANFSPLGVNSTRNLLYEINLTTGAAFSNVPPGNRGSTANPLTQGAWTNIVEHGALDTDNDPFGLGNTVIFGAEATITTPSSTVFNIQDGQMTGGAPMTLTVNDGAGRSFTFEFNSGPEVRLVHRPTGNPATDVTIRDGDRFTLDGAPYEFDTGTVLVVTATGNTINDGDTITITDEPVPDPMNPRLPITRTFEFDLQGGLNNNNNVAIPFTRSSTNAQIISSIISAVNSAQFNAQAVAVGQRISILNESINNRVSESAGGPTITLEGSPGVRGGAVRIPVEESMDRDQFGAAIDSALNGNPNASWEGDRLNFSGAITADFTEIVNRGVFIPTGGDGTVTAGNTAVDFLASDDAATIATRLATAITDNTGIRAVTRGTGVELLDGAFFEDSSSNSPLRIGGTAPGGDITGMTILNGVMYAVTDRGGLFQIIAPTSNFAIADYIETATDLLTAGTDAFGNPGPVRFAALTSAPAHVEGGRYSDMLIGIDVEGRLYAFDTSGELQPIFENGQTSIDTGLFNVQGLAFSSLDFNLWHVTPQRNTDQGHGVDQAFDGSRIPENDSGNQSLYFGYEGRVRNGASFTQFEEPTTRNTYDFPGGAQGSVISNPFSLEGYAAEDRPTLYFNYYLDTENAQGLLTNNIKMRDAFRVYASGDDGRWILLGTNNSARGSGQFDDEYDDFTPFDGVNVPVQELFDVGENGAPSTWRQARIPLEAVAGQKNIRLRFDFATAGEMDLGDPTNTGAELRTLAANLLRDGQTFTLTSNSGNGTSQQTFELDFGYTLVAPTGAAIVDGAYFIIDGQAYEFDSGNGLVDPTRIPIVYDRNQSAIDVATSIQRVILNNPPPLPSFTASLAEDLGSNDTLSTAVNSLLTGRAAIFQASGFIGDNPNLTDPAKDVDMVKVELQVGDRLIVDVDTSPFGALFDSALQILDADGQVVATSLDDPAPNETASTESYLEYTATRAGTFYVAVSGGVNITYDPITGVIDPNDTEAGSTGPYDLIIQVDDTFGIARRDGHRVNLPNAADVTQTNLPATFIEGSPGKATNNVAVAVHINMTAEEVAAQIASAMAGVYARGEQSAIKVYENIVSLIGTSFLSQSPGPYRGAALGVATSLVGDQFGEFEASTNLDGTTSTGTPGVLRARNNVEEGVYIDDIIVGFAERGEMFTNASGNTTFSANSGQPTNEINVGAYQLEMRRGPEFTISDDPPLPTLILTRSFDTNDPLTQQVQMTATAGNTIADGETFSIGDGIHQLTFEFDDLALNNGVTSGRVRVPFSASDTAAQVAVRIRDAINAQSTQTLLAIKAALSDGNATGLQASSNRINLFGNAIVELTTSSGGGMTADLTGSESNDTLITAVDSGILPGTNEIFSADGRIGDNATLPVPTLDVDLIQLQLAAGERISIDIDADENGSGLDSILAVFNSLGVRLALSDDNSAPGEAFTFDSYLEFTAPSDGTYFIGVSSYSNFFYDPQVAGSGGGGGSVGDYTIEIGRPDSTGRDLQVRIFDEIGDSNRFRDQGQIILDSVIVRDSLQFGIEATAETRSDIQAVAPAAGLLPHPGTPRNTRDVNTQRLAPGVVVMNSLLINNTTGGIRFAGDSATGAASTVPFGRIVNNTIVGPGGIGIQVQNSASPTILNNILADLTTAITVDTSSASTVIGGSVYQKAPISPSVGAGSFAITLTDTDPLFVNAAGGNYYLARGSRAIDSAIDSVQDRPQLVNLKTPLGIGLSPIIAPTRDALGQRRVDDPSVSTPPGQGASPFKDRGALDRADFVGPTAVLINPRDNDAAHTDMDSRDTYIELNNVTLNDFSIQLLDGIEPSDPAQGSGADDSSVTANRITLLRDGVKLIQGVDYRFNYDATNNIIRLTPVAGIWELDRIYDILLSNSEGVSMTAPNGTAVTDGEQFNLTDQTGKVATFEYDSGYTMFVPATYALQIPDAGGGPGGITDGQTFTIGDGTQVVTFEFDSNGASVTTNKVIPFTANSTANDIANAIVTAITAARLGLSPVNIVNFDGRAVHLGSRANHTVNVSQSSLTLTGQAAGVVDGETFTIDNGSRLVTFEFNATGTVKTGNVAIDYTYANTHEEIADRIVTAIRNAQIGLNPTHEPNSDGQVHLGGTPLHVVDVTKSALQLTGTPGAQLAWTLRIPTQNGKINGLVDGERFTISNGTTSATFELDTNNQITPGNIRIAFTTSTTPDQLANLLANAIRNANLGLTPTNAGGGLITLGGTATHTIDVTNTKLQVQGQPGVPAAIPVPFIPGTVYTPGIRVLTPQFTAEEMAVSIANAINSATAQGLLTNVTAVAREDEVSITGVTTITGVATAVSQSITDIAGNRLKANRATGETRFTILVGSGLDYGDAPSPYPTTKAANGARHVAVSGFFLGSALDADVDGQPNATATGDDTDGLDDEDGVTFNAMTQGYGGSLVVTASKEGILDAWIDFNGDGDWDDAGERIAQNLAIQGGQTTLNVTIPGTSVLSTFGRFRLSTTGVATPLGEAPDGEVEDHRVIIASNPWRNPVNGLDVNADGFVSPIDVLLVINEINRNGARALPANPTPPPPPPYFDVNGDGFLAPSDPKEIIDYLNSRVGSGEGEASLLTQDVAAGSNLQFAAASLTTLDDVPTAENDEKKTPASGNASPTAPVAAADTIAANAVSPAESVGKLDWDDLLDGISEDIAGARETDDSLDAIFASYPRRLDRFG